MLVRCVIRLQIVNKYAHSSVYVTVPLLEGHFYEISIWISAASAVSLALWRDSDGARHGHGTNAAAMI